MGYRSRYSPLFDVRIKHEYYFKLNTEGELTAGNCPDFIIKPAQHTENMLKRLNLIFRETESGFELKKRIGTIDDNKGTSNNNFNRITVSSIPLYFELYLRNPSFNYFTDIKWFTFSSRDQTKNPIFHFSFNTDNYENTILTNINKIVTDDDIITKIGKEILLDIPGSTAKLIFYSTNTDYKREFTIEQNQMEKQIIGIPELPDDIYSIKYLSANANEICSITSFNSKEYFYKTNTSDFYDLSGVIELYIKAKLGSRILNIEFPARESYWQYFIIHPKKYKDKLEIKDTGSTGTEKKIYKKISPTPPGAVLFPGEAVPVPSPDVEPGLVQPAPNLRDLLYNINEGQVLADFCLPYMCCSDLPPVTYVFQESDIEIKPYQKYYCKNDDTRHMIYVNPKGGRILENLPGLQEEKDHNFSFIPRLLQVRHDNKITYELGSKRKEAYINVILPKAGFVLEKVELDQKNNILRAHFVPSEIDTEVNYTWHVFRDNGKKKTWILIDTSTDTEFTFELSYQNMSGNYPNLKVSLTAAISREVDCSETESKEYTLQDLYKLGKNQDTGRLNIARGWVNNLITEYETGSEIIDALQGNRKNDVISYLKTLKNTLENEIELNGIKEGKSTEKMASELTNILSGLKNDVTNLPNLDDGIVNAYLRTYDDMLKVGNAVLNIQDEDIDPAVKDKAEKAVKNLNTEIKKDIELIRNSTKKEFSLGTFIGSRLMIKQPEKRDVLFKNSRIKL